MWFWLNPGEAGSVYLKAFEITKDSPLSESGLREASEERIGWSDNPDELFLMNTNFNIHEGEPGEPYAARFKVWFQPDTGRGDRKLLDKIFKIEGLAEYRNRYPVADTQ